MNNLNSFNNFNGYNSIYHMNDELKRAHVRNPYRICFVLNLLSIILAGIPSIFGILYVLFWVILGVCTFFWVWVELDFDFFNLVAKFSFLVIPFVIISLIMNIISYKPRKDKSDNKLMFITSLIVLLFDIVWVIGLLLIRKQLCSKFGNVSMILFLIPQIAGIICVVISIIYYNSIKKQKIKNLPYSR